MISWRINSRPCNSCRLDWICFSFASCLLRPSVVSVDLQGICTVDKSDQQCESENISLLAQVSQKTTRSPNRPVRQQSRATNPAPKWRGRVFSPPEQRRSNGRRLNPTNQPIHLMPGVLGGKHNLGLDKHQAWNNIIWPFRPNAKQDAVEPWYPSNIVPSHPASKWRVFAWVLSQKTCAVCPSWYIRASRSLIRNFNKNASVTSHKGL